MDIREDEQKRRGNFFFPFYSGGYELPKISNTDRACASVFHGKTVN